jgi:putative endonuclease
MRLPLLQRWWQRLTRLARTPGRSPSARGARAERAAARHLRRHGYRILQQNLNLRYGEIDLLAIHQEFLVIVEVRSHKLGNPRPRETISRDKLRRLRRLADNVHKRPRFRRMSVRIDLVEVAVDERGKAVGFEIIVAL